MNTYSEAMDSERTGSGSIAAFVCGAALGATVGAAIALIMAPASGRDTRDYLKRRGNELGRDAMERGRETLREQSERVKSAVATAGSRLNQCESRAKRRIAMPGNHGRRSRRRAHQLRPESQRSPE